MEAKVNGYFSSAEILFTHNGKMGGSELQQRFSLRKALATSAVEKSALTAGSRMIISGAGEEEPS